MFPTKRYPPQETLTDEELERGLRMNFREGVLSQAMVTLTLGAFLIAFGLEMGASNLQIGLLVAIPPLGHLFQLPGILLVDRVGNRRAIWVTMATIARCMWFVVAALPLLVPPTWAVLGLMLVMAVNASIAAVANCAWNSWMRDLLPQSRLGKLMGRRMAVGAGVGLVLTLSAGFFVDAWHERLGRPAAEGYGLLFGLGGVLGLLGVFHMRTAPEPMHVPSRQRISRLLRAPFRDPQFRTLIRFSIPWTLAVNLAAPFFTVYLLVRLGMDITAVVGFLVLSQAVHILFLRLWGPLSDRFNVKSVLRAASPLFMVAVLGWTFTTLPDPHAFTVPLLVVLHILMGAATAGVNLSMNTIGMQLAPRGQATGYLAALNVVNSLAAAMGPILGGQLVDLVAERQLRWVLTLTGGARDVSLPTLSLESWDFLFLGSFLLGLYALHRLAMVQGGGEIQERAVLQEMGHLVRRDLGRFSTAAGLTPLFTYPFALVRPRRPRPPPPDPPVATE